LVNSGHAAAQQRLALPRRPYRIAILAAASAGAADIGTLLDASAHECHVRRRAVPMVGARAADAVAAGIATLANWEPDVIVVARAAAHPAEWHGRTRRKSLAPSPLPGARVDRHRARHRQQRG
jgi:exonuclease VII large subunit